MIIFLIGLIPSAGAAPVEIEYYYLKDCSDCDHIKSLITGMECDLGSSIAVMYIDVRTPDGLDRFRWHGFHDLNRSKMHPTNLNAFSLQRDC